VTAPPALALPAIAAAVQSVDASTASTGNDGFVLLAIATAAVTLVALGTAVRTLFARRVTTQQPPGLPGWESPRRHRR
jgi:hypothetical protein